MLGYSYWMDFLVIWSRVSVRASLFALMVMFNILSFWSWDWTLPLRLNIVTSGDLLSVIIVTWFFIMKSWKWTEEAGPKRRYGFVEWVVILFIFNTRCDYVIPSDFASPILYVISFRVGLVKKNRFFTNMQYILNLFSVQVIRECQSIIHQIKIEAL